MFAAYGLLQLLVSDNGPQFTSTEFADFLKQNGIKHIKSAPYHPSTNGAAERFVRTLKHALKCVRTDQDQHQQLMSFLLRYRITPHATTNTAPCELFMGRSLRTRLDLLRPNLEDSVLHQQAQQKQTHDQHSKWREFAVGQQVLVRSYRPGPTWLHGTIVERTGPLSYVVQVQDGLRWKRHVDQLLQSRSRESLPQTTEPVPCPTVQAPTTSTFSSTVAAPVEKSPAESQPDSRAKTRPEIRESSSPSPAQPGDQSDDGPSTAQSEPPPVPPPRRSQRIRRPPPRLTYPPSK